MLSGGTYTTISFSNSVSTFARGINESGQIVGDYVDAAGNDHGFLYSDGSYTTLAPPGSTWTEAYGINAQGEIVGTFIDAQGVVRGFIATAVPEPASIILLAGAASVFMSVRGPPPLAVKAGDIGGQLLRNVLPTMRRLPAMSSRLYSGRIVAIRPVLEGLESRELACPRRLGR